MEWIVIIGHRSSKSTFSAQNENLRPLLNTNIPGTGSPTCASSMQTGHSTPSNPPSSPSPPPHSFQLLHILYQLLNILFLLLKHLEPHNLLLLLSNLLPEISANSTWILGFFGGAPMGLIHIGSVCPISSMICKCLKNTVKRIITKRIE